jgi:mRNA interferase RelE/StbE
MPQYKVELLDRRTQRQLDRIHESDLGRISDAILELEGDPRPRGCRRLRALEGWRIRVGSWRVIYTIDDAEKVITIVDVKRRREDTYR